MTNTIYETVRPKYLYLLLGEEQGWDTYDSIVVCAESEEEAKKIAPCGRKWDEIIGTKYLSDWKAGWASTPNNIEVEKIGIALDTTEIGVICSSFNAG